MTMEDNLKALDEALEALNDQDLSRFLALHAPDVRVDTPSGPHSGREPLRAAFERIFEALPDFRFRRGRVLVEGDWLCLEGELQGTHTGPWRMPEETIPATDRPVRVPWCGVFRFQEGAIRDVHEYYDRLGLLSQLGISPD